MVAGKEATSLSRVYSHYSKCNPPLRDRPYLSILFLNLIALLACTQTLNTHGSFVFNVRH